MTGKELRQWKAAKNKYSIEPEADGDKHGGLDCRCGPYIEVRGQATILVHRKLEEA